jgi:membrane protein required for colicin V production
MSSPLEQVAIIDAIGLLLILGIGIAGAIKGAVRYIVGLAAVALGVGLAATYGGELGAETWPIVGDADDPERMGTLVGGGVLFIGALLAGGLVAKLLRTALESASLGGIDRFLGFVFGAARGAVFTVIIVFVVKAMDLDALREDVDGSYALSLTRDLAVATRDITPEGTRDVIDRTLELEPAAGPR